MQQKKGASLALLSLIIKFSCLLVLNCNRHLGMRRQLYRKMMLFAYLRLCASMAFADLGLSMFSIFSMGLVSGVTGHRDQYALAVFPVEVVKTEQLALRNNCKKDALHLVLLFSQESDPVGVKTYRIISHY